MLNFSKYRNKDVYLWEDNEQVFVRSQPDGKLFAKIPGGKEYSIDSDTDIATRAFYADHEVTKQQYDEGVAISSPQQKS